MHTMRDNNLKYALRSTIRKKSRNIINILGLFLGITGCFLIFVLVDFHLSVDRYHANAKSTYRVVTSLHLDDGSIEYDAGTPYPMVNAIKNDYKGIKDVAFVIRDQPLTMEVPQRNGTETNRYLEKTGIYFTNTDFFRIFDFKWIEGDPMTALSKPNAVVLTKAYAEKYFEKENPIGKLLHIQPSVNLEVTGVVENLNENTDMKANVFVSLPAYRIFRPEYPDNDWTWIDGNKETFLVLPSGLSREVFDNYMPTFAAKYTGNPKVFHFSLQPLSGVHFDERYGGVISLSLIATLSVIGIFLLLIACINFINLATVQSIKVAKEIAVRKVLGSSRSRIFWQFMGKTFYIVLFAIILALIASYLALPYINSWLNLNLKLRIFTDPTIPIFLIILLISTVFFSGFYPGFILSGFKPVQALKGTFTFNGRIALRRVLVVIQFVIAQTLLICALVMASQINFLQKKDLGFISKAIVMVHLPQDDKGKMETLRNILIENAQIKEVSLCNSAPLSTSNAGGLFKFDAGTKEEAFPIRSKRGDSHFLETFGLKLIAGKNLVENDTSSEVLVNQALLRKLHIVNPQDIVGKSISEYEFGPEPKKIVGVVSDFHLKSLHSDIEPCLITTQQNTYQYAAIDMKGSALQQTIAYVKQKWQEMYPESVFEYEFLDEQIGRLYNNELMLNKAIWVSTGLAILISCLGLYGIISFVIVQRSREIGIRKVLGASVGGIIYLFSREFLKLVFIAFVIASPLAFYFAQKWLQSFSYRISVSWWEFFVVGIFTSSIAFITVSLKTVTKALENPTRSIKTE
jgi:putative ABC transport system permease protein